MTSSDRESMIAELLAGLCGRGLARGGEPAPPVDLPKKMLSCILTLMLGSLSPLKCDPHCDAHALADVLMSLLSDYLLVCCGDGEGQRIIGSIFAALPTVRAELMLDAEAIFEGDPAARSVGEVVISYPGFLATAVYRIAHLLQLQGVDYLPRMMTEYAHRLTGIDIHPAAEIGRRFCIDHGTGIVIGETARIGDGVKLYQGVTLGARSFARGEDGRIIRGGKRHPTVGDGCIIYAGATVLGGDTVIGSGSVIGGNVWLTHSVPPGSRIYYMES